MNLRRQGVQYSYAMSARDERVNQMRSDKSGAACDQYVETRHFFITTINSRARWRLLPTRSPAVGRAPLKNTSLRLSAVPRQRASLSTSRLPPACRVDPPTHPSNHLPN